MRSASGMDSFVVDQGPQEVLNDVRAQEKRLVKKCQSPPARHTGDWLTRVTVDFSHQPSHLRSLLEDHKQYAPLIFLSDLYLNL